MNKLGFSGVNRTLTSNSSKTSNNPPMDSKSVIHGRVVDIILDENHPKFKENKHWMSVGSILFEDINNPTINQNYNVARPLNPHFNSLPLINEIVVIYSLLSNEMGESGDNKSFYYSTPINLWNNPNHNAYPSILKTGDVSLGKDFIENPYIQRLKQKEGDVSIWGRYGNYFSFTNESSNPAIKLINNIPEGDEIGYESKEADIFKDGSSLYFISKTPIKLPTPFTQYVGFEKPPTLPSLYKGNQIVLNSDRLLLNSREDIILSTNGNVFIGSIKEMSIYGKKSLTIDSEKLILGNKDADQSAVLGDKFFEKLGNFLDALVIMGENLEKEPSLKVSIPQIHNVVEISKGFKKDLNDFLSKKIKFS